MRTFNFEPQNPQFYGFLRWF